MTAEAIVNYEKAPEPMKIPTMNFGDEKEEKEIQKSTAVQTNGYMMGIQIVLFTRCGRWLVLNE